jgi:putative transposase
MRSKPCLIGDAAERLRQVILTRADDLRIDVREVRILPDRVYVAVAAPPILSPHHIICQLKAHSSRCLRHEFQEMTRIPTVWTRDYTVLAGDGISPEEVLAVYEASRPPRRRPGRPRLCSDRD